jgi:hypothetical protein
MYPRKLGFNLIFSPEVEGVFKFNNPGSIFFVQSCGLRPYKAK